MSSQRPRIHVCVFRRQYEERSFACHSRLAVRQENQCPLRSTHLKTTCQASRHTRATITTKYIVRLITGVISCALPPDTACLTTVTKRRSSKSPGNMLRRWGLHRVSRVKVSNLLRRLLVLEKSAVPCSIPEVEWRRPRLIEAHVSQTNALLATGIRNAT